MLVGAIAFIVAFRVWCLLLLYVAFSAVWDGNGGYKDGRISLLRVGCIFFFVSAGEVRDLFLEFRSGGVPA